MKRKAPWYILDTDKGSVIKLPSGKVKFFETVGSAENHATYAGLKTYIIKHWNFPKNFYRYGGSENA